MSGFRQAKSEQAALKMSMFGQAGSGKTFTALLIAEGIAKLEKKKVAFVDTEHGTDFYAMDVPQRQVHPERFDFQALYTRSLTEANAALMGLDPAEYGVAIVDSLTHMWEAAQAAYTGKRLAGNKIPPWAWTGIKAPYKKLMAWMMNTPLHVMLLMREGNEWSANDETGEMVASGVKGKAEGETAYEAHINVRMEGVKPFRGDGRTVKRNAVAIPTMFVIKDRTGILHGRTIENPTFETVAAPILGLLGKTQAQTQTEDEAAAVDQEALRQAERTRAVESAEMRRTYLARFELAKGDKAAADRIAGELTPERKKLFLPGDLDDVREGWKAAVAGRPVPRGDQPTPAGRDGEE